MTLPFLAGVAIFLSMSCGVALAQPLDWAEYRNEKFGFALDYPRDLFEVERTAQAGDGQVFVTREGDARLLVGALLNGPDFTPNAYQKHIARQSYGDYKITYRRKHGTWFVLSGEGRGKVFYEKVMFSCSGRLINSFAMIYPADKRDVFNPIVERMEDTFRPGKACHGADMPSAKPRATQGPSRVPRGGQTHPAHRWPTASQSSEVATSSSFYGAPRRRMTGRLCADTCRAHECAGGSATFVKWVKRVWRKRHKN